MSPSQIQLPKKFRHKKSVSEFLEIFCSDFFRIFLIFPAI